MAKVEIEYPDLPENTKSKIGKREKRESPKMKVSGKRVFQLKQIKQRSE